MNNEELKNKSDIDLVIYYSKKFESLLEKKYGAEGRGLHEKVTNIERKIPKDIVRSLRYIATIRNKIIHQSDYNDIPDRDRFISKAESLIQRLEKQIDEPEIISIALQAANSKFICADFSKNNFLFSDRDEISDWEIFYLFAYKNKKYSLQASNGLFVSADENLSNKLIANRFEPRDWELFNIISEDNFKTISILAHNNKYVCADLNNGNNIIANRNEISSWETFNVVNLSNKILNIKKTT